MALAWRRASLQRCHARISVVLITQSSSEYSISFCVPWHRVRAERAMQEEFYLELKEVGLLAAGGDGTAGHYLGGR